MRHSLGSLLFWDIISSPKFPLMGDKILMLCIAASCVHLKQNTGRMSSLAGIVIIFLIVVTKHKMWDFCF